MADEPGSSGTGESGLTPRQYHLIQDLVEAAADRPVDQRESWIRQSLANEPSLILETLDLLRASENLDDDDIAPGTEVGNYRIGRELGRGGMGAVYLASRADGAYETQVAIKVVARAKASDELVARFKRERRILASLEHPNIARMIDAGTLGDGRPYLIMEYIRGRSITDYADSHNLGVKDRVRLFMATCGAVGHAHLKQVVHRDIKPSNILVTDEGVPKLVDFGIATSLGRESKDRTRLTASGMAPGTPRYASPEQLAGTRVDIRADVYALGVVLFELLTGWWPFVARASGETPVRPSDAIQTRTLETFRPNAPKAPAPSVVAGARSSTPRKLVKELRGDLDAIVSAALREDPNDRYESVAELTADLARYLAVQPVLARRQSLGYRGRTFARRNRKGLSVAAAVVVAGAAVTFAAMSLNASPNAPPPTDSATVRPTPTTQAAPGVSRNGPDSAQPTTNPQAVTVNIGGTYEFAILREDGSVFSSPKASHQLRGTLPMKVRLRADPYFLDDPLTINSSNWRNLTAPALGTVVVRGSEGCQVRYRNGTLSRALPIRLMVAVGTRTLAVTCKDNSHPVIDPAVLIVRADGEARATVK